MHISMLLPRTIFPFLYASRSQSVGSATGYAPGIGSGTIHKAHAHRIRSLKHALLSLHPGILHLATKISVCMREVPNCTSLSEHHSVLIYLYVHNWSKEHASTVNRPDRHSAPIIYVRIKHAPQPRPPYQMSYF